jgi:hypothetical protein
MELSGAGSGGGIRCSGAVEARDGVDRIDSLGHATDHVLTGALSPPKQARGLHFMQRRHIGAGMLEMDACDRSEVSAEVGDRLES